MAHDRTNSGRAKSPADGAAAPGTPNADGVRSEPAKVEALRAEIDRLRQQLRRSQVLATVGTLASGVCHEINNILTPVMSYAEMAMEAPGDAGLARKALERAYHGADRASRIASAILAFASERPRGAKAGAADVAVAVSDAWMCLAADPSRMGIQVDTSIEAGCAAAIDQVGLQQIILNLVLNAMKAMRPAGGRLSIRARSRPGAATSRSTWNGARSARPGSGEVVIEVEDTGCGIEPERISRVFEPFVGHKWTPQVAETPSGTGSGTGLGLTVCKHLVESAGGTIAVRSQVSVGTCFTITLPVPRLAPVHSEPAASRN